MESTETEVDLKSEEERDSPSKQQVRYAILFSLSVLVIVTSAILLGFSILSGYYWLLVLVFLAIPSGSAVLYLTQNYCYMLRKWMPLLLLALVSFLGLTLLPVLYLASKLLLSKDLWGVDLLFGDGKEHGYAFVFKSDMLSEYSRGNAPFETFERLAQDRSYAPVHVQTKLQMNFQSITPRTSLLANVHLEDGQGTTLAYVAPLNLVSKKTWDYASIQDGEGGVRKDTFYQKYSKRLLPVLCAFEQIFRKSHPSGRGLVVFVGVPGVDRHSKDFFDSHEVGLTAAQLEDLFIDTLRRLLTNDASDFFPNLDLSLLAGSEHQSVDRFERVGGGHLFLQLSQHAPSLALTDKKDRYPDNRKRFYVCPCHPERWPAAQWISDHERTHRRELAAQTDLVWTLSGVRGHFSQSYFMPPSRDPPDPPHYTDPDNVNWADHFNKLQDPPKLSAKGRTFVFCTNGGQGGSRGGRLEAWK